MATSLHCYNCGQNLDALTPPLSRRDACPACALHLHVCRMCVHFDANVLGQCLEDDAEEVLDKRKVNFCDWFAASPNAFDGQGDTAGEAAARELGALFGDAAATPEDHRQGAANGSDGSDDALSEAEKLFR